jgi:hypothetical protein
MTAVKAPNLLRFPVGNPDSLTSRMHADSSTDYIHTQKRK